MRLVLGLRWVTTGRLGLLVDLVTLQQCRWGRQTWAVFSVMCRMPKWLKQWIIWNAPENRIQRGSKARLFDILWKMWWSSHVTINMQSLTGIHAPTIPYAWTTVVVHVARSAELELAWPGANLHMFAFFFIKHLSISQHVLKSFEICFDPFCWAHLSQTAWQITTAQATIITHKYLT